MSSTTRPLSTAVFLVATLAIASLAMAQDASRAEEPAKEGAAAQTEDSASTEAPAADAPEPEGDEEESASAGGFEDVIVVWGERSSTLNSRQAEREKDVVSSVMSPDDVGNFSDQNTAESLRRLPGLTLERSEGEGRFVTVRGLGPGFVRVSMDGAELASAAEDSRAFALDALPSDILGSIEVHKSLTPDMDLSSIGGAVNVRSISAFDRGGNTLKAKLQGSHQEVRGETGYKAVVSGTQLFADERVGLGFTLSYEDRPTLVDEIRHHSTGEMVFLQQDIPSRTGPEIIAPRQLENRQETADRERIAGSFNLELHASDSSRYYLRGGYTELEDLDVARREFFDFQDAGGGEIAYVNAATGEFALSDIDVFHQLFIQEGTTSTSVLSLGGENELGSGWMTDYEYSWSKSNFDKPNGRRVQFRESDLVVFGQGFGDRIIGRVITPQEAAALGGFSVSDFSSSDIRGDASDLSNFHYDNLFIEDSFREDELETLSLNLRRDFSTGSLRYAKVGVRVRDRSRDRNKDRWSFDPDDGVAGCGGDAECATLATSSDWLDFDRVLPSSGAFIYPFVTLSEAERLIAATRATLAAATNGEVSIDSTKDDYRLAEDTMAAYLMGSWELGPRTSLIAGLRWEDTDFESSGFFSIENDDFQFLGDQNAQLDIAIPMEVGRNAYNDLLPSIHLRYEPRSDLLVRAAVWTSFVRPSFAEARAFAKIDGDIELCVPGTRVNGVPGTGDCDDSPAGGTPADLQFYELARDNSIQVGNPNLQPMTSTNVDAAVSWYGGTTFLEATVFYKDISDFIVPVSGATLGLDELPVPLPVAQVSQFTIPSDLVLNEVDLTVNGDQATVYGVELSYSHFFSSGVFLQGNTTLLHSEATLDPSLRVGDVALPGQADLVWNFATGWENEKTSVRVIANYRDQILEAVGACGASADPTDPSECRTWSDRFQDDILNVDFKASYRISDKLSLYFDAINLTDERDLRYFHGNDLTRGRALFQLEEYGRSFQLGLITDLDW